MNETTTVDQRVATVREFVASVFNGHEPDLARKYMTPEVVWHGNTVGTIAGVDTVVAVLGGFIGALPDIHAEEQDVIASDDLVAVRLVVSATQTGDLLGIPASGRAVRWDAVDIYRVTTERSASSGPSRTWLPSAASSARSRCRGRTEALSTTGTSALPDYAP